MSKPLSVEGMAMAQNRHDKMKWKKKKHPASKCGNAKCLICHSDKVMKMPDRQTLRENSKQYESTLTPKP